AAEHLPHDHLDVLVVDAHALQAVDLLHLVHQVLGERLLAEDGEDVVRVRAAVHERLACLHVVALVDADVLALGDQVLARLAHLGRDDDLPLALGVLAEGDDAVDLADDRELLRLARLEELGDARQAAGDVLGLGGLARHLGDDVARRHALPLEHVQVRPDRQQVARLARANPGRLPPLVLDRHARPLVDVLGVDDHLGREPRALVELLLHGDAFEDVAELHHPRTLGEDRDGVRVPLRDHLATLHLLAVALLELRAVHHRVALALAFPVGLGVVDDRDLAVALAHHDQVAVLALDRRQVDELDEALVARLERGLLGAPARRAADVERPHGQLRARLAARLRGDDADRLAQVHHVSARPLRAPYVEMKYWSTVSPSRKLAVIGVSMSSPEGLAIRPRMPASWRICCAEPRAPESAIMKIGLKDGMRRTLPSWSGTSWVPSSRSISSAIWSVTSAQMSTTLL